MSKLSFSHILVYLRKCCSDLIIHSSIFFYAALFTSLQWLPVLLVASKGAHLGAAMLWPDIISFTEHRIFTCCTFQKNRKLRVRWWISLLWSWRAGRNYKWDAARRFSFALLQLDSTSSSYVWRQNVGNSMFSSTHPQVSLRCFVCLEEKKKSEKNKTRAVMFKIGRTNKLS